MISDISRATFLTALYDGCEGLCELRALPSTERIFVAPGDWVDVEAFVARAAADNLYMAIATRADASSGARENCRHLGALYADLDFKATPESEARDRLARLPLRPSAVVQSGGGLHVYWFLREPLDLRDSVMCGEARQLLRRLACAVGADLAAAEPARVLRLPGTLNRKPEYGAPRPVLVEALNPDQRYNPSELDELLPPEPGAALGGAAFVLPERIPAHEPGRNQTLWRYGRSLRAKGWKMPRILAELERVNRERCEPPLSADELGDVAHNVMVEANRPTFSVRPNGHHGDQAGGRPNLTDMGNAVRLVAQAGEDLRYVYSLRSWFTWTGARWERDDGATVMARAKQTVRSLYGEAAAEADPAARTAIAGWARKSEHEARIRAMVFLAQSEPGVPLGVARLDTDYWALNALNGSINLRTGELRPHCREDYCTKLAPVAYDPHAQCPQWLAFLARIFAGKAQLIAFVQRAIGYSLTGDTSEPCFFLLWGGGANGKTTMLKVIASVLGNYALSTRPETFMLKGPDNIPNDMAQLRGARFVVAVEAEQDRRLAEALMKQATGGDTISARFMRAEFFQFVPTFKIFIGTNHKPVIRGTDYAMWRRVRLIPFTVTIPPEEQDRQLEAKLREEGAGILRWAVEECLAWQRHGLGMPDEIRAATAAYRTEMDVLGQFIAERCVLEDEARVSSGDLYGAYGAWCEQTGERPMAQRTFGLRLTERGVEPGRTRAARGWLGIRLRTLTDPDLEAEPRDATGPVTHGDASFLIASHDARAIGSYGKSRHMRHQGGDASPGREPGDEGEV